MSTAQIGLGLAALGRPGYINLGHADDLAHDYAVAAMQARAHAVLDAAWAAGVRYFDAARSYGRAEAFLSSWLAARRIAPSPLTVASKWGYTYTAEWRVEAPRHEVKDHGLATLDRQLGETRALLGAHLDLYQIHSATLDSGVLDDAAVLDRLADLRDDGIRVGLSVSGPNQADTLRRALQIRRGGAPLFTAVQATWNLLERAAAAALGEAHSAGWRVIVKEGLANGRLTGRNTAPSFDRQRQALHDEATRRGCSADALALAAALAQPWADVVLSGAATVAQLTSNLRARAVVWDEAAERALANLIETPDDYWQTRGRLEWN
ncbi:MAG: aldo/keto reductase [bacterium]